MNYLLCAHRLVHGGNTPRLRRAIGYACGAMRCAYCALRSLELALCALSLYASLQASRLPARLRRNTCRTLKGANELEEHHWRFWCMLGAMS